MKRVLSLLLVLVMLVGMMPIQAFATEGAADVEASPWSGRSAVFVGDSITAGDNASKYYRLLEQSLDLASVTVMGVGGSCFSAYSDYGTGNQPLINRYQNIPSTDLIMVFMGTNDYGHETPLGSVEDTQDGTFYGALNTIIPALVAKHTSSKIVFVTPLHRYGFGTSKILGTQFTYDNIPNGVGATLGDYVDALKTVCANNGVSVIDLHTEYTLDPSDADVRAEYMSDGLHPNASGHAVIAGIMESHLRTFEPVKSEPVVLPEMIQGNKFASTSNQPCRASSRINYYLKAGTVITLKNPDVMQWACARTSNEFSSNNLGYFPDSQWTDKVTAIVAEDGWIGFTFKYRDETQSFDLTRPLSDYITIHTHSYSPAVTAPTCTEQGYTTYTCECGDSYVDNYTEATGHSYENGICAGCGVSEWDTDGDGVLEILAIGNSFSVDALQYAYQIAQNLGIEKIAIGNLYIGGCTLATHAANAAGDLGKYTYYFNDNGTWTSTGSYKISTALESRSWDYVSMQQGSPVSGVESSYNEDLTNLIAYVKERSDAKLVWHMTWAYQQNSTHSAFPTYGKNQMTMYNAIISAVQNKIVTNSDIDLIVPNGTAVQNSRTSSLGDTTTRDGYHMSYDYGRYLTGLLFIKTVTGLSIDGITYAPSGVDAEEKAIAIESVNHASAKPFEVTQSAYVKVEPEIPDEGYILLKPELHKGAYWHSINADHYNTPVTDASNSKYFFATIRFTREMLPVGSIIILEDGWQYRPEGWITDTVQTSRADTSTESYVVVTEEWWGDYAIRGFNISKVGTPSIMNLSAEDIHKVFRIYVPEEKHTHTNTAVVTAPTCTEQGYTTYTCTLCGDHYVGDHVDAAGHTYENGICLGCGEIADGCIWQIVENGEVTGAFAILQDALDACESGGTIRLTENCAVTSGANIQKDITIDGGNHFVDISRCSDAFIIVAEGVEVTIQDLMLDGGADGFAVDYDAVTYTNYTIPLVSGSLDNDPKANQSAIISHGTLVCENVDISNRYTASVGGAVQLLAGSATLVDCDFIHNYGTSKGGALYIGSKLGTRTAYPVEMVTITNCTFTDNYSGHGGAIYAYNMAHMVVENTDFVGNTANGGKGGAIDLFSETTQPTAAMALGLDFMQTTIKDCRFENNWAGNDGFAIQSYDSDLYIYNSEFIRNVGVHPSSSVGTVSIEAYRHADTSWRIYTLMDGCLFEGNQGPCAVYGDHSSISDLDVTNCVFRNNVGNDSFLLYAATSNLTDCRFIGEEMAVTVIDARIYDNYEIPPLLTLTDVSFADCAAPTEILTRKQNHNDSLNTYQVVLQGSTNGDITIWDNNSVSVESTHSGNVQLGYGTERTSLTVGENAVINGILYAQPVDGEARLGEKYMVEVLAEGKGLKYQWYFRNAGASKWNKSSVKDNTYDDVMTQARAGREVYCVITDQNGNSVKTDTVQLICIPSEELEITKQPTDGEAVLGERYCVSVEAKGEGLKYQWYFRNKGATRWTKSTVRDNTYDDVMNNTRNGREVYCVITDLAGNQVTTDIVKLVRVPMKLEITSQPTDATAAFGEDFCATVVAKGEGLKYQWYYRNAGATVWHKSGVHDNTYDDVMNKARNGRELYCVITDKYGNSVTTDTVKLIAVPSVELKLLDQSYESAVMGERYCVTVEAVGDGLQYQWYFRNAGTSKWHKSSVRDNTYDDVMNRTRANREVYCVITDAFGNRVTTEVVTLKPNT